MIRGAAVAAVAAVAACHTQATPSGFSGTPDNRWTMPLVGAFEDGLLVTPVTIGTMGPYLFELDPDAQVSAVDAQVVKEVLPHVIKGPPLVGEAGTPERRRYVDLVGLEIGSLIIERRQAIVVRTGTFDTAGRRIHGVLGSDVLDPHLVLEIDRERGMATLVEPDRWKPPAGAISIPYRRLAKPSLPGIPPRRVVSATIGGEPFDVHIDLGVTASRLRAGLWDRAKLTARPIQGGLFDEIGTPHRFDKASEPTAVSVGAASSPRVAFVPFDDARWTEQELAGSLGLGFFAPYTLWLDRPRSTLYLAPRGHQPLSARIGRWDTGALDKCTNPGCVTMRLIDPLNGKPWTQVNPDGTPRPRPGVILSVTREERAGGMPLEVVLSADRPELPLIIVNMTPVADRIIDQLPPAFAGVRLEVIDASPYPRPCPTTKGCVDKVAR